MSAALEKAVLKLVKDYQDLNTSTFHRTGKRSAWSLLVCSGLTSISDSVRRADSIVNGEHFVEPATVKMSLTEFFRHLEPPAATDSSTPSPVYYLQSQNGNMQAAGDLAALLADVGDGPQWATEVFQESADVVANIWIGDDRSVSAMHKDPYENIYLVVRGTKTFTLMPPVEFPCLHEGLYSPATYSFTPPSTFTIVPTPSVPPIPWIPVDPTSPDLSRYPRFRHAQPLTVTLHAGDMLYLPALWFHRVAQTVGPSPDEDLPAAAIAVNWWFPLDFAGGLWSTMSFVRRATLLLDGRAEAESDDEEEKEVE